MVGTRLPLRLPLSVWHRLHSPVLHYITVRQIPAGSLRFLCWWPSVRTSEPPTVDDLLTELQA